MVQRHFDNDFLELKSLIAKMSKTTSDMVENAIRALVERDSMLARATIAMDETVDSLDVKVDAHCLKLLAKYEPKAIDLRSVTTALRLIVDLERVGDHCVSICKDVIQLNELPQLKPYIDLPVMAHKAAEMVVLAVEAYFNKDIKKAVDVIKKDDEIDGYMEQITRELLTYIVEDLSKTRLAFSLINVTRRIERIADHATNIAEQVYFMATGQIVRHKHIEEESSEHNSAD